MGKIPFLKMHGLGNDFVILDGRRAAIVVDAAAARALADRRTGIGCDQLILLEPPRQPTAQVLMRIRNPDGGEVEACGNATRCVADLLRRETGDPRARIERSHPDYHCGGPRAYWAWGWILPNRGPSARGHSCRATPKLTPAASVNQLRPTFHRRVRRAAE